MELQTQSHKSAILSREERLKIRLNLPLNISNGYRLIQEKLPHLTTTQIGQAFLYDNRYKVEVMVAALQVIDEANAGVTPLKNKVAEL